MTSPIEQRGATARVEIESLAEGGDGVGHLADGRVIFVSSTAPGDLAVVTIVESRRSYARGRLDHLERVSPLRVPVECSLHEQGRCGGCPWLHVDREAQLAAKAQIVANALRHELEHGLELEPILAPVAARGWRRRARLRWHRSRDAALAHVGFVAPRSHQVHELRECAQLDPRLLKAVIATRDALRRRLLGQGEVCFVVGHRGAIHVSLEGSAPPRAALEALIGRAGIVGVRAGKRVLGEPAIELEPGVQVAADDFVQVSAAGNDTLRALVRDRLALEPKEHVLELFAGSGNFTRDLVGDAREVVAIEQAASEPVAGAGVTFRAGEARAEVDLLLAEGARFDVALIDPPRGGAQGLAPRLAALGVERLVYVSCNPATLARDLAALREVGFRPHRAVAVDLMPQTSEVEVVVSLVATAL